MKLSSSFLLPLVVISLFTRCTNSGNAGTSTVSSVQVTPASATVNAGQSRQFSATVAGTGSPSQAVTWTAQVGQITSSGSYTAPLKGSTDVVWAFSVQTPAVSGQATVTVAPLPTVTSVAVSPSAVSMLNGQAQQFTAIVNGTGNPEQAVTWSAESGQITQSGLYTAPAAGSTDVVRAASVQDPSVSGQATVTLQVSTVSAVTITPASITLANGKSQLFSATVTGTGSPSQAVNWSAQYGQITSSGTYTAPATGSRDLVTAQSVQSPGVSGQAVVTLGPDTGAATFNLPAGLAVDNSGNVFVADTGNGLIRKITPGGVVTTLAGGGPYGVFTGIGTGVNFQSPSGIALDASGNVYVADLFDVGKITSQGVVTIFWGEGSYSPYALAMDGNGNVVVSDWANSQIYSITPAGLQTNLVGGAGTGWFNNGPAASADFYNPHGVAVDATGNIYVADTYNHLIRLVTPDGMVSTYAGQPGVYGSANGPAESATFNQPYEVAVDAAGNVYVVDYGNSVIRKITQATGVVSTFAGSAGYIGHTDGPGASARFSLPEGIAIDGSGNLYVADTQNCLIRKITPDGTVSTIAGVPGVPGSNN